MTRQVTVEPLTGTIGAVRSGIDLTAPLPDEIVADARAALLRWRVVFPRDQHLTPGQQVASGRAFGELTPAHPLQGGLDADHPEVRVLVSRSDALGIGDRGEGTSYNNRWHTDVTFSARPPTASILAAKEIPERGGDTLWADLVAADRTLSPGVRDLLDPLVAVHDAARTFDRFQDGGRDQVATMASVRRRVMHRVTVAGEQPSGRAVAADSPATVLTR